MLTFSLSPGDRLVVNGCVMRNLGTNRMKIGFENRADILRGRSLLSTDDAVTPVTRIMFRIQCALLDKSNRAELLAPVWGQLADLTLCFGPDMRRHITSAVEHLSSDNHYGALIELRSVRAREAEILQIPQRSTPLGDAR